MNLRNLRNRRTSGIEFNKVFVLEKELVMSEVKIDVFKQGTMSVADIAKQFNVSAHTVVRWMNSQGLPYVRIGKKRFTTMEVFNNWTKRDSVMSG